jgi:hypothetical protein
VQQRDQQGDVVTLKGVHVPSEQRALVNVHRLCGRDAGVADVAGREGGPGSLQRTVNRRHAGLEQLGHLGCLPAQHLTQDQHRPLPGGQALQNGDEREADGLPRHRQLGRVTVAGQNTGIRDGLYPCVLRQHWTERPFRCGRRPEVHWPGPTFAAPQHVEAHVSGDAVEP